MFRIADLCLNFAEFDLRDDYEFLIPTRVDSDIADICSDFADLCLDFADLSSDFAGFCSDFADLCLDFVDFNLRGDYEFRVPHADPFKFADSMFRFCSIMFRLCRLMLRLCRLTFRLYTLYIQTLLADRFKL